MSSRQPRIVSMSHLSSERLAALSDSEPTRLEAEHLAECVACGRERVAHQRLLATAAAEQRRLAPPLTEWTSIAGRLAAEGLLVPDGKRAEPGRAESSAGTPSRMMASVGARRLMRIAAALALTTGGVLAGRASAGATLLPASIGPSSAFRDSEPALDDGALAGYASTGEALVALTDAQREYHRASAFLAAHDTASHGIDESDRYRARLAALDQLAETSRQALYAAPADPVLNQYYLSALGAREATIRQIGRALPVGMRLTRF